MPILGYLIRKGNTTVYEWRTGTEPKKIERPKETSYSFDDESEKTENHITIEEKIDFGDFATIGESNNQNNEVKN